MSRPNIRPTESEATLAPATVTLKGGRLYFSSAVHDRYFAGLASVILMRRDDDLLIMPVRHAAAGGYVIKIRNAAGDRLVEAIEFFRSERADCESARELPVFWNSEAAALVAEKVF